LPPSTTNLEIVSTLKDLEGLGPDWDRLAARFSTPLLSFDWFNSAATAFHQGHRLAVFIRRSGDDIVAVAPLVERRKHGVRTLEFIGSFALCEPSGILYDTPGHLRTLLADVVDYGLPVSFERVSDPVLVAELSALAGCTVGVMRKSAATVPWIRISGSWKEYYEAITPKWRSAHRRAIKKAEGIGPVEFEFFSPNPSEFDPLMERFVAVEGEGWKARLGTALRINQPLRAFFELYGRNAAGYGAARFAFLKIGDAPVAAQFGVEYFRRHWLLKIGYDEHYSHGSPGILLMHRALERAFDGRLEGFEFLGSNETWIQIWNHKTRKHYTRSIDRVAARRLLTRTITLSEKVKQKISTRLARSNKRS
jgi:CelD/BcsL family acetyltransferase involved in cellulose biosynthesis